MKKKMKIEEFKFLLFNFLSLNLFFCCGICVFVGASELPKDRIPRGVWIFVRFSINSIELGK